MNPVAIDQNDVIGSQFGFFPADWFAYLNSLGASGTLGGPSWSLMQWASDNAPANWPVYVAGAQQFQVFKKGNTLYCCLMAPWNPPTQPVQVPPLQPQVVWSPQIYKSTDGGLTWQTMNPIGGGPQASANQLFAFDGDHTIFVAVFNRPVDLGFIIDHSFDLNTEEWSTFFFPGISAWFDTQPRAILPDGVSGFWIRPDGSYIVLSGAGIGGVPADQYLTPFDGGARFQVQTFPYIPDPRYWNKPFFVDQNFPHVNGSQGMSSAIKAVMDASGNLHCVFAFATAGGGYFAYQQILSNDTLGPGVVLAAMPALAANPRLQFGTPFLFGGKILLPIADGVTPGFFFLAADLTAPTVWAKFGPVDPARDSDPGLYPTGGAGSFCFDGTFLYFVNICPGSSNLTGRVRVCYTTDLVNWAAYTGYDIAGSQFDFPAQVLGDLNTFPGSLGITLSAFAPGSPIVQTFVMVPILGAGILGGGVGAGPGIGPGGAIVVKGTKRVKSPCSGTLQPVSVSPHVKNAL